MNTRPDSTEYLWETCTSKNFKFVAGYQGEIVTTGNVEENAEPHR